MKKQLIISVGREFGSGGHVIAETLAKRFDLPLRPAFMHRFYDVYVPAVPFCSAVFCPNFHPKPGIRISFCLGHSDLYPRRYPAELPVCLCRCPDCHEPDKAVPVFIPAAEKRVFCSNLSASPLFRRKDVLLRGTHRRHALLLLFQPCLLPDL